MLVTMTADGTVRIVPMRYNASHQRGRWKTAILVRVSDLCQADASN
ncbi:MAG: hypothetical protein M3N34_05505 [Pseudomonadota bacterium]|nr:hypothetical protein [Pseudomonadota bacterium]